MGNRSLREKTVRNIKEKITQLVVGGLLSINKTIIRAILKSYKKAPGLYSTVDWRQYNSRSYNLKNSKIFHLGDGINFSLLLSNDNSYTLNV
jgi:alpha-tubulin suppressor-like RCC1 family protein